ncbi:MAG: hypothetical protein LBT43_21665 [Prevotella sp.]|jgi:hypothetical protein|nr:hypothetical protein [Prevotella sp.]MDR2001443.1 hypothetical protein [Prevotella sp.]
MKNSSWVYPIFKNHRSSLSEQGKSHRLFLWDNVRSFLSSNLSSSITTTIRMCCC